MSPPSTAAFDLSGLQGGRTGERRRGGRTGDAGKRSFLRLIGHELRTPLNSVIGFSEIIGHQLYGPIGDARYAEHALIVRDSGLKLLKLVNQVMEIVRLESGAAEFDLQPLAGAQVAQAAVTAAGEAARERGVDVRLETRSPLAPVMADERALQTILGALLDNAMAHAPKGTEVVVGVRMAGLRHVCFEVRDEGPGIPADQIARLMRPFEQASDALTRGGEGAGLGLHITRLTCEAMDGRLKLHAPPGCGLSAVVRLPAA